MCHDAEGATATETFRQKDRSFEELWKVGQHPHRRGNPDQALMAPANLSGFPTEGAIGSR